MLSTVPADGELHNGAVAVWSEVTMSNAKLTVFWKDATARPLHLRLSDGSGYAHFQDRLGCEYWARLIRQK
jgi:hypothetical protein